VGREPRTGVSGGQAALAVIMVAGIGVTALLLRPDSALLGKGRGPLGHNSGIVLLLAFAWLVGGLLLSSRYRARADSYGRRLDPAEQRLADTLRTLLAVIPFALPFLLLVLHRFGQRPARLGDPVDAGGTTPRFMPPSTPPVRSRDGVPHVPGWLTWLLLSVVGLVALAAVVLAAWFLWRLLHRPARQDLSGASYDTSDEEQERLAQAVDSGRRALLDGEDARAAVIACYAAMEESLAASGVARRASDSPQDLLERVSAGGLLTGGAAGRLTALFREARYSTHPMDTGHRDRAAAALADIAAQLDEQHAAAPMGAVSEATAQSPSGTAP